MERERAESEYAEDYRVDWVEGGGRVICQIQPIFLPHPSQRPNSDLNWDGKLFPDEHLEIEHSENPNGGWRVIMVKPTGRVELTRGGYLFPDCALAAVLGDPR